MDFKNLIHLDEEIDGKKIGFYCDNGTTFGMIYDFSTKLRQFSLDKMNENKEKEQREESKDEEAKQE